jgi:hypothetical protein
MRTKIVLMCLLACGFCPVYSQQKPATAPPLESSQTERYQLTDAQVESTNGAANHELFLLDQQTGRVWRYQRSDVLPGKDGKSVPIPDLFIPIEFLKFADESPYRPTL